MVYGLWSMVYGLSSIIYHLSFIPSSPGRMQVGSQGSQENWKGFNPLAGIVAGQLTVHRSPFTVHRSLAPEHPCTAHVCATVATSDGASGSIIITVFIYYYS